MNCSKILALRAENDRLKGRSAFSTYSDAASVDKTYADAEVTGAPVTASSSGTILGTVGRTGSTGLEQVGVTM